MDILDFKNDYLNQIFEIISKEQIFLLGDFHINRLNYNDQPTNDLFDSLVPNSFMLYILMSQY